MKVHFVYPDIETWVYPTVHHGLASISAVLKKNGHKVSLHHIKKKPFRKEFVDRLKSESPDIVCFSSTTNQHSYVKEFAGWVKEEMDVPTVSGGVHPTIAPDEVIRDAFIDIVCRGEGEYALLELCEAEEGKRPLDGIENLWLKRDGGIIRNTVRDVIDLDELPFPDYEIFDEKTVLWKGRINLVAGRGCPFECSYCCNHLLKSIFRGKGPYVRMRKADSVLDQIERMVKRYSPKTIFFEDDTFTLNKNWALEFCEKYSVRFDIPFVCNGRFETIDDELLKALASAHCYQINYGLESGNEWIRKKILNRNISNDRIKQVIARTKENNIKVSTYNMIGIPFETVQAVKDTIELNRITEPDHIQVFYFYPYPSTKLHKICEENNLLTGRTYSSYCEKSALNLPSITNEELDRQYDKFSAMSVEAEVKARYPSLVILVRLMNKLLGGAKTRKILTWIYRAL